MRAALILLIALTGCATPAQFAAYTDERQMVVFVFDGEQVRHAVIPHDPENSPACRVITGPVSEMRTLMLAQGVK
jgi:hypothetical protein